MAVWKRYNKKLTYSYSFGIYPTVDLLRAQPDRVLQILLKEESYSSDGIEEIKKLCQQKGIPIEVNPRLIEKLAYKENTYAIGVFEKYESILNSEMNHVLLVNPTNMGNVGTIIRTMAAFGLHDLGIVKPGVDIFDPKVVRSAMGGLFRVRFRYFGDIDHYLSVHPNHKYYPFMLEGGRDLKQVAVEKPFTLIFGNEGAGLAEKFAGIGQPVYIPQNKEVDSLNLSIAAAIAMWHFCSISAMIGKTEF